MAKETVTGNLGHERVSLNNAATEATLEQLLLAVKALASQNSSKTMKLTKTVDEVSGAVTELYESIAEEIDFRTNVNTELDKSGKILRTYNNTVVDVKSVLSGVASVFNSATPNITNFASAIEKLPIIGSTIGAVLVPLASIIQHNISMFRSLSNVGIDFGNDIYEVQRAAANAGIGVDEFSSVLKRYSSTLVALGNENTAGSGASKFSDAMQKLNKANVTGSLMKLGYTQEQVADGMARYIQIQSYSGKVSKMTTDQLAYGTARYLTQIDALSRATGMQRDTLQESIESMARQPKLASALAAITDPQQKLILQTTLAQLQKAAPDIASGLGDLLTDYGVPITQAATNLKVLLTDDLSVKLQSAINNVYSGAAGAGDGIRAVSKSIVEHLQAVRNATPNIQLLSHTMLGLTMEASVVNTQLLGDLKAAMDEATVGLNSSEKGALSFDQTITALTNNIKMMLLPVVSSLTTGLSHILNPENIFKDGEITAKQLKSIFLNIGDKVTEWFEAAFPKAASGLETAFTDLTNMFVGFASFLKKLNLIPSEGGSAKSPDGATADGGSMVAGFGTAVVGMGWLAALAGTLGIFATTPVLAGAGVIALLGASLIPMSYAMSIAAPNVTLLTTSMERLSQLNPIHLTAIGGSLSAIGFGLGVLTASSAIHDLSDWVTGFFGSDTLFDNIEKLSNTTPKLEKFSTALNSINFKQLDMSAVSFDSFTVGAAHINNFSAALNSVNAELKAMNDKSMAESFNSLTQSISLAINPNNKKQDEASSLLSSLNYKIDMLNTNLVNLLIIEQDNLDKTKTIADNTTKTT